MPGKKSTSKTVANLFGNGNGNSFPCGNTIEVRIPGGVDVKLYQVNAKRNAAEEIKGGLSVSNENGLIICAQVPEGRHILPYIENKSKMPVVALFELKEGFPRTDKVRSPCLPAKPTKKSK